MLQAAQAGEFAKASDVVLLLRSLGTALVLHRIASRSFPRMKALSLLLAAASAVRAAFWMESIAHHGISPLNPDKSYAVFRNVRDFGAKGDGGEGFRRPRNEPETADGSRQC